MKTECDCGHDMGHHTHTGWCRHVECDIAVCRGSACYVCNGKGVVYSFMNGRDHVYPCPRGCESIDIGQNIS